jgi:Ca-activated chloride channel family protein
MRYRYTKFDPRLLALAREKQLKDLFFQLLMHTSGNVEQALKWLDDMAERYRLWGEGMDMEKFKELLQEEGYITAEGRPGRGKKGQANFRVNFKPTRKVERALRLDAFETLFSEMSPDALSGDHLTPHAGGGGDPLPETRPYVFGDRVQDIDFTGSISNAIRHSSLDSFSMSEDDLEVFEVEHTTSCATVLALDISHSMILYGEDRITPAKRVALAMSEMIQTHFPKDALEVIVFGDEAMRIDPRELAYVQVGPFHTNTKAALELSQRLLDRKKHGNKQIILITDGKASAIHEGGQLYINTFGLDAKIVNKTVEEAQKCRRRGIVITTFMIATDPYLKKFVQRLSEANKGRAYFADLENLGKFVAMDFLKNRKRNIG